MPWLHPPGGDKLRAAKRSPRPGAGGADGAGRKRRVLPRAGAVSPGFALAKLGEADLRALAAAIRSRRLGPPFGMSAVQRITGPAMASAVADALKILSLEGCPPGWLASCLEMIADTEIGRA